MISTPGITVNDAKITAEQINSEVQYHPAESLVQAKYEAMRALVVRELLIQRAVELGITSYEQARENPDDVIDRLFDLEIKTPKADKKTCQTFYENNKSRFCTPILFEAAHILYLAPPGDDGKRRKALDMANNALQRIRKKPETFEMIARAESACSSAKSGGHLGQISKGQTTPAFESALQDMQDGDISKKPVSSEFGYHIIKLYKRIEGRQLPFELVHEQVADYIERKSWQRAFSQYVQLLAAKAKISGFQLRQADSLLVQ